MEANSKFSNLAPASKISTYKSVIAQSPKLQLMAKIVRKNNNKWTIKNAQNLQDEMFKILDIEKLKNN